MTMVQLNEARDPFFAGNPIPVCLNRLTTRLNLVCYIFVCMMVQSSFMTFSRHHGAPSSIHAKTYFRISPVPSPSLSFVSEIVLHHTCPETIDRGNILCVECISDLDTCCNITFGTEVFNIYFYPYRWIQYIVV